MNREALRGSVMRMLRNRASLEAATVNEYLNSAYLRLARGKFIDEDRTRRDKVQLFDVLRKTANPSVPTKLTFVAGGCVSYPYPADCDVALRVDLDGEELTRLPLADVCALDGGDCGYWADDVSGRRIVIGYAADETATAGRLVTLSYYAVPAKLTADTDEPVLPEPYHPIIALLASRDLLYEFGEDERSRAVATELRQRLAEIAGTRAIATAGKVVAAF